MYKLAKELNGWLTLHMDLICNAMDSRLHTYHSHINKTKKKFKDAVIKRIYKHINELFTILQI